MSPYGDFDTVVSTLRGQLARGPWMLGERFTAADVLWGTGLTWSMRFKIVPEYPEFTAYTARLNARPAIARGNARNEELAAAQQAASSNSA